MKSNLAFGLLLFAILFLPAVLAAPKKPDLTIDSLTLSTSSAYEGENVTVTVVTKNIGTAVAGSSTTRVANGNNLYFSVSSLAVGASQTNTFSYTCGTSNVTFTANADYFGVVSESNEGNNQAVRTLECKRRVLPDLIVENISFLEYSFGGNVTFVNVTSVVRNIGNESVGKTTTTRLSGIFGYYDWPTINLAPGQAASYTWLYVCSSAHYFNATADFFDVAVETNEDNNRLSAFIDCII